MVVAKPWARMVRGYKTASLAGPLWPCLLSCPPGSLDRGALYNANTQSCSEASRQTGYSTTPYLVSSCSFGRAHGPALPKMCHGDPCCYGPRPPPRSVWSQVHLLHRIESGRRSSPVHWPSRHEAVTRATATGFGRQICQEVASGKT